MAIQEGKRIYVESLLIPVEYHVCSKKYPNTYNTTAPAAFFNSEFNWRWRMGGVYTSDEIQIMNQRLEELREFLIKPPKTDVYLD